MTRDKAIRMKCLECAGDSALEVTLCHITDCHLWPFRIGRGQAAKRRIATAKDRNGWSDALKIADDPKKFEKGF